METNNTFGTHAKAVLSLGLPLIGSHIAQMAIGVTDTVMLGWYSVEALAALTLASSYFFVIFIFCSGFAGAVMPLVAEAEGKGNTADVRRVTRMGIWISLLAATLVMPLFIEAEFILGSLGQESGIAFLGEQYLIIAGFGIFPALMVMTLKSYLSALERTGILLWATIGSAVLNVFLNYLLIFGNWGAPELGVRGAAIASVATQVLSLLILIWYAQRVFPEHALFQRFWRADWGAFFAVFRLGAPISFTMLAEAGLFAAAALMVGWVGTIELAAHGIAVQLAAITFMVHLGLGSVATIRAGRAYGRQDEEGLRMGGKVVTMMSFGFSVVTTIAFVTFPEVFIGAFLDPGEEARTEIVQVGVTLLVLAALFQLADGTQAQALGLLRGVQDTRIPMIYAALSYWGIGVPVAYILSQPLGYGAPGVWIGLVVGLSCAALFLNARFWRRKNWIPVFQQ
ncbi:MATE family efflux transporter [Cochlodiniinecator piscidefendens]|uniref:MATE family efflux transporter n=1 Tax=Cochlodiniinecator piscidefendens TaxID=2715756 RepID=UPI00140A3C2B|nr:MATE family efflux transporter [Cochlodiniinecator piscidefendens]